MKTFITLAIVSAFALSAEGCNNYAFERCLTDFTDKYPEASNSFSPAYSEEQLVSVCRDFDIAARCVQPTIRGCSQEVKVLWQVLDNVMVYMCSDRTKLILKNHTSCIEGKPLQQSVSVCNSSMQATTNKIKRYGGTADELCRAMKSFASCTVDSADRHCGPEVASWYGGLVDAALDPTKGLIDCYFTAGGSTTKYSLTAMLMAFLLHYLFTK